MLEAFFKKTSRKRIESANVRGSSQLNRARIESARVRGSNKDGRDVFLDVS